MKWINHHIVTGSLIFAITGGNFLCTAISMAGSVLPDMLEGKHPEDPDNTINWARFHRRLSHWFVPYGIAFLVCGLGSLFSGSSSTIAIDNIVTLILQGKVVGPVFTMFSFLAVGCLFHIVEDALCGSIPSINPRRRIGMSLFRVGSFREYVFSIIMAGLFSLGVWI